jgi:hypothetical protein
LELALNKSKVFPDKEIIFGGAGPGLCIGVFTGEFLPHNKTSIISIRK